MTADWVRVGSLSMTLRKLLERHPGSLANGPCHAFHPEPC